MRDFLISIFLVSTLFFACQDNKTVQGAEKSVEEIKQQGEISNADIIRNPVSANEPEDTVNVAKMVFEETSYDFGSVKEGSEIEHIYHFQNTGKIPLVISNAKSTCGCTVPDWPKDPIAPGRKGKIKVLFKTKGKKGNQMKPVTITANTYPRNTVVHISGEVLHTEKTN